MEMVGCQPSSHQDYLGHRADTTLDIDEPHFKSLVEQGIAEDTQGDPYGPLMAKAMVATIASLTKNIETVFNEAIRPFGHAKSKSRRNAISAAAIPPTGVDSTKCTAIHPAWSKKSADPYLPARMAFELTQASLMSAALKRGAVTKRSAKPTSWHIDELRSTTVAAPAVHTRWMDPRQ